MRVESLGEAIDWIQSRSISATAPIEATRGREHRARMEAQGDECDEFVAA
jgi:hypothetical protein